MAKSVDIHNPLDPTKVMQPCCELSRGKDQQALPTLRSDTMEYGYVIESLYCDCQSRWFPHDWKKHGHATFATVGGTGG